MICRADCDLRPFAPQLRGQAPMNSKATILIVDDEPDLREVLEEYFVAQGFTVLSAESANAARALAAQHPVDVALLDIAMPHLGRVQRGGGCRAGPHRALHARSRCSSAHRRGGSGSGDVATRVHFTQGA